MISYIKKNNNQITPIKIVTHLKAQPNQMMDGPFNNLKKITQILQILNQTPLNSI